MLHILTAFCLTNILHVYTKSCCPPHTTQSGCVAEPGNICTWISDPNNPIVIASSNAQCLNQAFVNCKLQNINAICSSSSSPPICGPVPTAQPTTPTPTLQPTRECQLGSTYAFEGYPCQLSGDPHVKMWNGNDHDFQGQPSTGKDQFYYVHNCAGSDNLDMPFNILGTHYKWLSHAMSGIDYFTVQLFDTDGTEYFVFLSSALHSFATNNLPTISTHYDANDPSTLTQLVSNQETFVGNRFKLLYIQTSDTRIDVTLTIDDECEIKLFMQGQHYFVHGRYKMHYVSLTQSKCYKCNTCGLCGNFKDLMTGADIEQLETCDGSYMDFRAGWNAAHTPEAYDLDGWGWEKHFVENNCGNHYDNANNNGQGFSYNDPCVPTIKPEVVSQCQAERDVQSLCCATLGGDLCDQLQKDCEFDACVAAEGDVAKIKSAVQDIFSDAVGELCTVPEIGEQFTIGNLANYQHLGCWTDQSNRALNDRPYSIVATIEECAGICGAFHFFGVEYGKECFCEDTESDAKRYGPSTQCWGKGMGGPWSFNLFQILNPPQFEAGLIVGKKPVIYKYYKDIGAALFNEDFRKSNTFIIRRDCPQCVSTHQQIFYKRITMVATVNVYSLMKLWVSTDNLLGIDFNLFSTLDDAIHDRNAWNYCNYDDTTAYTHGIAAFRDCGPNGRVNYAWCSNGFEARECRFSIYTNPTVTPPKREYFTNNIEIEQGIFGIKDRYLQIFSLCLLLVFIFGIVIRYVSHKNNPYTYEAINDPIQSNIPL